MTTLRTSEFGILVASRVSMGSKCWIAQERVSGATLNVFMRESRVVVDRRHSSSWFLASPPGVTEYFVRRDKVLGNWMWRMKEPNHRRPGFDPVEVWVADVLNAITFHEVNSLIVGDDDESFSSGGVPYGFVDGWRK